MSEIATAGARAIQPFIYDAVRGHRSSFVRMGRGLVASAFKGNLSPLEDAVRALPGELGFVRVLVEPIAAPLAEGVRLEIEEQVGKKARAEAEAYVKKRLALAAVGGGVLGFGIATFVFKGG